MSPTSSSNPPPRSTSIPDQSISIPSQKSPVRQPRQLIPSYLGEWMSSPLNIPPLESSSTQSPTTSPNTSPRTPQQALEAVSLLMTNPRTAKELSTAILHHQVLYSSPLLWIGALIYLATTAVQSWSAKYLSRILGINKSLLDSIHPEDNHGTTSEPFDLSYK